VIKAGKYKAVGHDNKPMTEAERELMQEMVEDVHDQFVEVVAEGRGIQRHRLKDIADGRVFSGHQAKEVGLVDELGSLRLAAKDLAKEIGINSDNPPLVYPKRQFRNKFFDLVMDQGEDANGRLPDWQSKLQWVLKELLGSSGVSTAQMAPLPLNHPAIYLLWRG